MALKGWNKRKISEQAKSGDRRRGFEKQNICYGVVGTAKKPRVKGYLHFRYVEGDKRNHPLIAEKFRLVLGSSGRIEDHEEITRMFKTRNIKAKWVESKKQGRAAYLELYNGKQRVNPQASMKLMHEINRELSEKHRNKIKS